MRLYGFYGDISSCTCKNGIRIKPSLAAKLAPEMQISGETYLLGTGLNLYLLVKP